MKICTKCKIEKPLTDFSVRKTARDGRRGVCRECRNIQKKAWRLLPHNTDKRREAQRKYYLKHKEEKSIYRKGYYQANKEREVALAKVWQKANREKYRDWYNAYSRERYHNDPLYKLKDNCRSRIRKAIIRGGYAKRSKTAELLGCNWKTYKQYIENQFEDWMTWDNRGEWHIDHIVPLNTAQTEDELMKLFHYENTRPLCAIENIKRPSDGSDV